MKEAPSKPSDSLFVTSPTSNRGPSRATMLNGSALFCPPLVSHCFGGGFVSLAGYFLGVEKEGLGAEGAELLGGEGEREELAIGDNRRVARRGTHVRGGKPRRTVLRIKRGIVPEAITLMPIERLIV